MTDKAKKRRRELAKNLEVPRRTAANIMRARTGAGRAGDPPQPPTIEVIHSCPTPEGVTYASQCPKCNRWLWCGSAEHDAVCVCGQPYRVVFDVGPDCMLQEGRVCMHDGLSVEPFTPNPWRQANDWQFRCDGCSLKAAAKEKAEQLRTACRMSLTAAETTLRLVDQYEETPALIDLAVDVRAAMADAERHTLRIAQLIADGGDDRDPAGMAAINALDRSLADFRAGLDRSRYRIHSVLDRYTAN